MHPGERSVPAADCVLCTHATLETMQRRTRQQPSLCNILTRMPHHQKCWQSSQYNWAEQASTGDVQTPSMPCQRQRTIGAYMQESSTGSSLHAYCELRCPASGMRCSSSAHAACSSHQSAAGQYRAGDPATTSVNTTRRSIPPGTRHNKTHHRLRAWARVLISCHKLPQHTRAHNAGRPPVARTTHPAHT